MIKQASVVGSCGISFTPLPSPLFAERMIDLTMKKRQKLFKESAFEGEMFLRNTFAVFDQVFKNAAPFRFEVEVVHEELHHTIAPDVISFTITKSMIFTAAVAGASLAVLVEKDFFFHLLVNLL